MRADRKGRKPPDFPRVVFDACLAMVSLEIGANDPPEVRMVYNALRAKGWSERDAELMMGIVRMYHPPDQHFGDASASIAEYVADLLRLPVLPGGSVYQPLAPEAEAA